MEEFKIRTLAQFFRVIKSDFAFYRNRLKIESALKAILVVCLFHPGWQLLFSIRVQEQLGRIPILGSLLRRFVWYLTSIATGSEVSFMARFGDAVYFPHPTGVVIGDSWDVGAKVTIMQGVTLGRKDSVVNPSTRSCVHDGAVICSGAVVVGELSVGPGAVIGANAVVLKSVPASATAVGVPAKLLNQGKEPA